MYVAYESSELTDKTVDKVLYYLLSIIKTSVTAVGFLYFEMALSYSLDHYSTYAKCACFTLKN